METLSLQEEKIVAIAAFAAKGDQKGLENALVEGFAAGATVAELKEILVQLYAYCGFPRSLNALSTLKNLVEKREKSGIRDEQGAAASPLPDGKSLDFGTKNQTKLVGAPVAGPLFDFAPSIDEYLKAHLFGDIFARDVLDWRTRELATIAMLATLPGAEPQLQAHLQIGKNNGLTDAQIAETLKNRSNASSKEWKTLARFRSAIRTTLIPNIFAEILSRAADADKRLNAPMFNVTFEPGCRNNWHRHAAGQLLIAVGGVGYYQERGKAARRLVAGDVVEIAPEVEHWHGAAPDSWFSHLAVECNPETNKNVWLEPVSDDEYRDATANGDANLEKEANKKSDAADFYTFDLNENVSRKRVEYKNRYGITLVGDLYASKDLKDGERRPGLIIGAPYGGVKEQSPGVYANELARRGFVVLTFDPSFNGESGGEPRHVSSPDVFVEDFSAGVDYLGTRSFVDREKIGAIGICGSGGFALCAAQVDRRIQAVATASMYDMSRCVRNGFGDSLTPEDRDAQLKALGEQRWKDFENGAPEYVPSFPATPADAVPDGLDPISAEFFGYYGTKRGFHPRARANFTTTSQLAFKNFPLLDQIETISPRPILFVVGENAHSRYFSEDAFQAAAEPKEFYVVPDADHVALYDRIDKIPFDKFETFFKKAFKN